VVQIGDEVRPADSCSSEAPVAHACWRGGEEKWCGGTGGGARPFIRGGGRARRHRGGGWRSCLRPPLTLGGGARWAPFPGEEEAGRLVAVTVECSAHWREGEAARGGEGAPGIGATGTARR
jgi:hypothetical protein